MSIVDEFADAIRTCDELPQSVREAASSARAVEQTTFDSSYLDFLDEQIELNARGDEWSQRLRNRRSGLTPWCDIPTIRGTVEVGSDDYNIRVDPGSHSVVYWEHYADVR